MKHKQWKKWGSLLLSSVLLTQLIPANLVSADTMTNDQYVYQFLRETLGLPHASAAGLMANVDQECAFNPTAYWTDVNGLTSYGLMQWNGARFEDMKAFCAEKGYDYETLEGQLAYLQYELNGPYHNYYQRLLNDFEDTAQGAYDAAYFWAVQYEVCLPMYFERRAVLARDYYYPAYEDFDYNVVMPEVFSGEMYISLKQTDDGLLLTDSGRTQQLAADAADSSQTWKMKRSNGAGYQLVNCRTRQPLTVDHADTWEFYPQDEGYVLKAADTEQVLTVGTDGKGLRLLADDDADQTVFTMSTYQPTEAVKPAIDTSAAPSITHVTWTAAKNAEEYTLRIYQGREEKGKPVLEQKIKKVAPVEAGLPAGEYVAVLEAENRCGVYRSIPVTFTVEQQPLAELPDVFYGKILWEQKELYLTVSEEERAVAALSENFLLSQLWQFVRNDEDGSYTCYAGVEQKKAMTVQGTAANAIPAAAEASTQRWYIYGDEKNGYVIQSAADSRTLTVSADVSLQVKPYENIDGQMLQIENYEMNQPVLNVDASGGIYEPVKLTWESIDCAASGLLEIVNENGEVTDNELLSGNETEKLLLLEKGSYQATLTGFSAVDDSVAISETLTFDVKHLPQRPLPSLQLTQRSGEVEIHWNDCLSASRYTYTIRDTMTGSVQVHGTSQYSRIIRHMLPSGFYELTICAENEEGSITSEPLRFTVAVQEDGSSELSMRSLIQSQKRMLS